MSRFDDDLPTDHTDRLDGPADGNLTSGETFVGCFAVIAGLFVPTAAVLTAVGFWQVGWPWAFGALAGLAGGATLCVFWYLLLKPR